MMIKVLQIIDGYDFSGIIKLMLDVEKNINKNIKFDFLTATNIYDKFYNLNIDRRSLRGRFIYKYRLYKFLKEHKYDIVHINSGAFFFTFSCVLICKLFKVKIVVHSHNTPNISKFKRILIRLLNPLYMKITDAHLSCSKVASYSLYTKLDDVLIIKNGINVDKYKFNKQIREKIRKNLKIHDKIVYGHVGRFDKQKNHEFLIDIFYELQKKQDCVLLLVGTGILRDTIKEKVKSLNIQDKVLFLDFRNDVNDILNAMDIFLFPSLYEGLSIAAIETQTNGLPIVVSSNISDETKISNDYYAVTSYDIDNWVDTILNIKVGVRTTAYKNTIKKGFDIKYTTKQLEKIYKKLS